MEIQFQNIILRDYREADIDDEIRWSTTETQWALWDAPWETAEELADFDPEAYRKEAMAALQKPAEGFRRSLEVDTADGVHIGCVNTYLIDEAYQWIPRLKAGQRAFYALGIEINESSYWNHGFGTNALTAYIQYHLENSHQELYLQTWSGNLRMIRCAEKLGFRVCDRKVGIREVRGGVYDGLTFRLDLESFRRFIEPTATCES